MAQQKASMKLPKPRGRPPFGDVAMTPGERQQRWRARRGQISGSHMTWVEQVIDEVMHDVEMTARSKDGREFIEEEIRWAKIRIIAALKGEGSNLCFTHRSARIAREARKVQKRAKTARST